MTQNTEHTEVLSSADVNPSANRIGSTDLRGNSSALPDSPAPLRTLFQRSPGLARCAK